ncbi:hypothetical protein H0H92_007429 [Tricholoma furcatifolium]|nr:hypothetical protein H0H92_007429 [Tricholoma furcatifolium]
MPAAEGSDVEFDVHLFEKAPMLGMDCSSVSLPRSDGAVDEVWRVDVPMRSFQGGYYPRLIAFYRRLGVALKEENFTYSFSMLALPSKKSGRRITTSLIYNGSSGRKGLGMPAILDEPYQATKGKGFLTRAFTRLWTLGLFFLLTLGMGICFLRSVYYSIPLCRPKSLEKMTFGEWAERTIPKSFLARWIGMDLAWKNYTDNVLVPLFSGICTAPEEDMRQHPVEEFLDFIWLTLGTQHYVVMKGVRDVVARLTSTARNIHLASTITALSPNLDDSHLTDISCDTPDGPRVHMGFHHIIFATQAPRAVPLLASYRDALPPTSPKRQAVEAQLQCLQNFKCCSTIVVNHTDPTLLPDNPRDWRELNVTYLDRNTVLSPQDKNEFGWSATTVPLSYAMATHVLRPPTEYSSHLPAVYQTSNPIIPPDEETVLSVAKLERAVLTVPAKEAMKGLYRERGRRWWQCAGQGSPQLGELQGAGIPLLEGCVVSARAVVEQGIYAAEGVSLMSSSW